MKKIRLMCVMLLCVVLLTVGVSAVELGGSMDAEVVANPYHASIRSYDYDYDSYFVKGSNAKLSFLVDVGDGDAYYHIYVMDQDGREYAHFSGATVSPNGALGFKKDVTLNTSMMPVGSYVVLTYISPTYDPNYYCEGSESYYLINIVDKAVATETIYFSPIVNGEYTELVSEIVISGLPQPRTFSLFYEPYNATGVRKFTAVSDNPDICYACESLGELHLEPGHNAPCMSTCNVTITTENGVKLTVPVTVDHFWGDPDTELPEHRCSPMMGVETCAKCGATRTVVVEEGLGEFVGEVTTPATCCTPGVMTYTCTYCGSSYEEEIPVDPDAHQFEPEQNTIVAHPTACKPGEVKCICTLCQKEISEEIPAVFSDLSEGRFYSDAIDKFYELGIVDGMPSGLFAPKEPLTRGMLVTMLYRMEGKPESDAEIPFTDVAEGRYFYQPIVWAYENQIATGMTESTFEPNSKITREQLAMFLYRYAVYKHVDVSGEAELDGFPDVQEMHAYSENAISWACFAGIINGSSDNGVTRLLPRGEATRAEAVTMLYRYCSFATDHPVVDQPDGNPEDDFTGDVDQNPDADDDHEIDDDMEAVG